MQFKRAGALALAGLVLAGSTMVSNPTPAYAGGPSLRPVGQVTWAGAKWLGKTIAKEQITHAAYQKAGPAWNAYTRARWGAWYR